jgi:hypothetical protein
MRQIPIETVEEVERELPEIVDAIQARSKGPIVLVLGDFEDQQSLFFNAVWYATSHDRRVVIEPVH